MIGRSLLLICLLTVVVAGCVKKPHLNTETTYTAPTSASGRLCLAQCKQAEQMCDSTDQLAYQTCRVEATTRASAKYQAYLHSLAPNQERKYNLEYFLEPGACSPHSGRCGVGYRDCFMACGGKIVEQTYCVSNCELMKPPQPNGSEVGPPRVIGGE